MFRALHSFVSMLAGTRTHTVVVIAAVACGAVRAQQGPGRPPKPPLLIAAQAHRGFIIPHSKELVDVSGSRPFGIELDVEWLLHDSVRTRRSGVLAKRGVALHLIDLDAPDLLGRAITLTPFVEPLVRGQDRLHGSLRFGAGLAFGSQPYDAATNPDNLFYSTHLSFSAMIDAYVNWRLTPYWHLRGGFNYNHISNGGMRQPNKGINYPTWSLGAVCSPTGTVPQRPVRDRSWRDVARRSTTALVAASLKNAPPQDGVQELVPCWVLGAMGSVGWRLGRLTGVAAGAEVLHDGYARELLDRAGDATSAWETAVCAGPELLSGRVRFSLLFGAYLHAPAWQGDAVYQRYQLGYTFGRGFFAATSLQAHRHVAEVWDVRLGWTW